VRVDPGFSAEGTQAFAETPDFGWAMARATTATRKCLFSRIPCADINSEAVPPRVAEILFAGKAFGFQGVMPGIAEEAMCALRANLAVYIVGVFGAQRVCWPSRSLRHDGPMPSESMHTSQIPLSKECSKAQKTPDAAMFLLTLLMS
jgi:hypothetical protein